MMEHLLLAGGVTRDWLLDKLYEHDEDGGPITGVNAISVMLIHLQPTLKKLNLEMRTIRHNSRTVMWLTTVAA